MLDDTNFLKRYSDILELDILKFLLSEEEFLLLKLNYLLIKNNFKYSDDYSENKGAKLLAISHLAYKYKILDRVFSCATIDTFFRLIDSKVKELLNLYGRKGLNNLQKIILENNIQINTLNDDNIIFLAIKYNIILDGLISKKIEKVKTQIIRYGNILPYLKIEYSRLSKRVRRYLYIKQIETVADIYDIYNGYIKYSIDTDIKNELYNYMFSHQNDEVDIAFNKPKTVRDLDEEILHGDIIAIMDKFNKIRDNRINKKR